MDIINIVLQNDNVKRVFYKLHANKVPTLFVLSVYKIYF